MRLIGELDNLDHANTFVAHLRTEGITSHLEQEGEIWEVWVKEEDFLARAADELETFQQNPTDAKYRVAVEKANQILREEEQKRKRIQKNIVNVSQDGLPQKFPLTLLLIGISALVSLLTNFGEEKRVSSVSQALAFVAVESPESVEIAQQAENRDDLQLRLASVLRGEVWRLVTPIFIHHGVFHIVFNMIWLFQLGKMIEVRYKTFALAILVLSTAALSNLAQGIAPEALQGSVPGMRENFLLFSGFGGMSGVVYALFGFIWVKSIVDPSSRLMLPQSTVILLVAWLFFCMTPLPQEWFNVRIANWAHGVGLLAGMIAGYLPTLLKKPLP